MLSRHLQNPSIYRIEVRSKLRHREESLKEQIEAAGVPMSATLTIRDVYFLEGNLSEDQLRKIAEILITDPVTESYTQKEIQPQSRVEAFKCIETTLKPGVTDNVANQLLQAAQEIGISDLIAAKTGQVYLFSEAFYEKTAHLVARGFLVNDTIQSYALGSIWPEFVHPLPCDTRAERVGILDLDNDALIDLSKTRRLALNIIEMQTIQAYYKSLDLSPTDAELETIAQTWSEHCVHKTFKANIRVQNSDQRITSMIKTYLQTATDKINAPWVRSAFVDNAGVIAFDDQYDLSFKVETHNHPSAIEPFGGANTGVGGVVRDILGVSHRPIANTNVLCFGPLDLDLKKLPKGVLHPQRIKAGVVHGIEDYGNKLGLPTVNGSICYHPGYTANPLVYCGSVGIGPIDSHPRSPQPGDRVIVLGGRTGRDGIRGATFSSQAMDVDTSEIAGSSVQIGDPITEKGLLEVVERARDANLYTAITDCGAGGLSSSVGEMSAELGAEVDLRHVPLKYPGLSPWEIWLSEAQERVVLAVPKKRLSALQSICDTYWVELSNIGEFQDSGRLKVTFGSEIIVDLDNQFLHHGIPPLELEADLAPIPYKPIPNAQESIKSETDMLLALLSHPDITSKEDVIRQYDHEVRGSTIVKPLTGPSMDGPSDAAVIKPANTKGWKGFSLANGINPHLGEIDAYNMAISVIDEAIRNAVVVGADPSKIAILDNFCWGNPNYPEVLGSLVRAAQGCYDAAVHYRTPFISGKDSLYNEYIDEKEKRRAIPGTLLISSIGIVPDIRQSITMDLKADGNLLYFVGDFQAALAGSHAVMVDPIFFGDTSARTQTPSLPAEAPQLYQDLHSVIRKGLIRSAHDLSEGGLSVALAEMALAGRLGVSVDISALNPNPRLSLFAETNACILIEVSPEDQGEFENMMGRNSAIPLGQVVDDQRVKMVYNNNAIINVDIDALVNAFVKQELPA